MDLNELLARYPTIRTYSEDDQTDIAQLFAENPIQVSGLNLVYDRQPDFSALLRAQGSRHVTFVGREANDLSGFGSVSSQKRWVNGRLQTVSYLGDFRVRPSLRTSRLWRKFYSDFICSLPTLPELAHPEVHLTAILKSNEIAHRAFVTRSERWKFRYSHLQELTMVNVFGRWRQPRVPLTVQPAASGDAPELQSFLYDRHRLMNFGYDFSPGGEWAFRLAHWPGFRAENFLIVRGRDERIVACCLPWAPTSLKRMVVTRAPWALRGGLKALKLARLKPPQVGQAMSTLYLTHLIVADDMSPAHAVTAFLHHGIDNGWLRAHNMISFCDHTGFIRDSSFSGLIRQETGVNLFTVQPNDRPPLELENRPLHFEMALV